MQWLDEVRRHIGRALEGAGLGPEPAPFRRAAVFRGASLLAYGEPDAGHGPVLLILPAPFKRPYVWDLMPKVSVVRHCLASGIRVYLVDWRIPRAEDDDLGLACYAADVPRAALEVIEAETGDKSPILAGHSLGGTFAAIFATLMPQSLGGIVLVDSPLVFGKDGGPLGSAVRCLPHAREIRRMAGSPVPGTVINMISAAAAPEVFYGQRSADLAASLFDPVALSIYRHVERWALDEFPLPGRLFEDVVEQLYREDRFRLGTLEVGSRITGIADLEAPVMAVTNPKGILVPPSSIIEGLALSRSASVEIMEYPGGRGQMIQHLGPLVSEAAHVQIWPRIISWILGRGAG